MIIGLLVLGLATGVMSGLFGVGGGIVMVPALLAIFRMDILDANATSLAAMLLPVGILGVIAWYRAGFIDLKKSLWISLGLLVGSFFGAELAIHVSEGLLAKLYAAFLLYVAIGYLDIPSWIRKFRRDSPRPAETPRPPVDIPVWACLLLGVIAGVIAGLFGKGGGLVIVPALIAFFRYDPKVAAATSLAALQLPVGLPSVIVYAQSGHLNLLFAALIASGILLGVLFGTKIAIRMPGSLFKKVYALFLLSVAVYMVLKYL